MSAATDRVFIAPVSIVIKVHVAIEGQGIGVAETSPIFGLEVDRDDILSRVAVVMDRLAGQGARLLTAQEFFQECVVPELYGPMARGLSVALPQGMGYETAKLEAELGERLATIKAERAKKVKAAREYYRADEDEDDDDSPGVTS